jgi:hypothetical protein
MWRLIMRDPDRFRDRAKAISCVPAREPRFDLADESWAGEDEYGLKLDEAGTARSRWH